MVISTGHSWINIVLFQMSGEVAIKRWVTVKEHVGHFDLKLHAHVVLELVESFLHTVATR